MTDTRTESSFETREPWETAFGPGCEARDCTYAANVKYGHGMPWLCDDHKADWLEDQLDAMRPFATAAHHLVSLGAEVLTTTPEIDAAAVALHEAYLTYDEAIR